MDRGWRGIAEHDPDHVGKQTECEASLIYGTSKVRTEQKMKPWLREKKNNKDFWKPLSDR